MLHTQCVLELFRHWQILQSWRICLHSITHSPFSTWHFSNVSHFFAPQYQTALRSRAESQTVKICTRPHWCTRLWRYFQACQWSSGRWRKHRLKSLSLEIWTKLHNVPGSNSNQAWQWSSGRWKWPTLRLVIWPLRWAASSLFQWKSEPILMVYSAPTVTKPRHGSTTKYLAIFLPARNREYCMDAK